MAERVGHAELVELVKRAGARMGIAEDRLTLDYAPTYGGYVIRERDPETGGVSEPFGSRRRKADELADCIRFALHLPSAEG